MKKPYQNHEWMIEHYTNREKSMPAIAREAKCSIPTIWYWLHKLEIPVRTISEGTFLAERNSLILSSKLLELLRGELSGDGCVLMMGNRSALYKHSSKYKEYVIWLSGQFANLGLRQAGRILKGQTKWGTVFRYTTKSYPELVAIRKRWYPNGKKIVPKALELTPIMARQWYIGDGCLYNPKKGKGHSYITFATCGFDIDSVNYLVEELQKHGFKAARWPASNTIGLSAYSTQDFLEWIGPCPISCYDYKWAI